MVDFDISLPNSKPGASTAAQAANKELNAYIYQQVFEIQPFLAPNTNVAVAVQQKKKNFVITLSTQLPTGPLKVISIDRDVYEAIRGAKDQMIDYLAELSSALADPNDRQQKISALLNGSLNIH